MTIQPPLVSLRNCLAAQPHGHILAVVQEPGTVAFSNRRQPDAKVNHSLLRNAKYSRWQAYKWKTLQPHALKAWANGFHATL